MDITNEKHVGIDWKLAKHICLYQILNPNSTKMYGCNVYHIALYGSLIAPFAVAILYLIILYHSMNDINATLYYSTITVTLWSLFYKLFIILRNSSQIWNCFEILKPDFLSYQRYDRKIFQRRQNSSRRACYAFIIVSIVSIIIWNSLPYIFKIGSVVTKNLNNSLNKFQTNVLNLNCIPDGAYNIHFNVCYFIELFMCTYCVMITVIGISLILIMFYAFCGQLDTIKNALESLGHVQASSDNAIGIYNFKVSALTDIFFQQIY